VIKGRDNIEKKEESKGEARVLLEGRGDNAHREHTEGTVSKEGESQGGSWRERSVRKRNLNASGSTQSRALYNN